MYQTNDHQQAVVTKRTPSQWPTSRTSSNARAHGEGRCESSLIWSLC